MTKYIDADALINQCEAIIRKAWDKTPAPKSWSEAYNAFEDDIEEFPAADVVEVVHGRWIAEQKNAEYCEFKCSECDSSIGQTDQFDETEIKQFSEWFKFCPNCGCDMRGESNGKE